MYQRYYREYQNEVDNILGCYLFWRMLQKKPSSSKEVLRALNKTPLSWILTRHSLQVTLFITLGRVFDSDDDAFSLDDLLKYCINNVDIFSPASIRERKVNANDGKEPEWISDFIKAAHTPAKKDFQCLRGEATTRRKVFERIYRPIRHKLIAHKDKGFMDKAEELYARTNISELEEIIWFLNDLKNTLFNAYENGRPPKLMATEPDIDYYERDFEKLLNIITIAP